MNTSVIRDRQKSRLFPILNLLVLFSTVLPSRLSRSIPDFCCQLDTGLHDGHKTKGILHLHETDGFIAHTRCFFIATKHLRPEGVLHTPAT
jgi:hypothetical protein